MATGQPTTFDRLFWNPLIGGLPLAYWLYLVGKNGWDFSALSPFRWIGLVLAAAWFGATLVNFFSRGRLARMVDGTPGNAVSIPDTFAEFDSPKRAATPLLLALREGMAPGADLAAALDPDGDEASLKVQSEEEAFALLAAYREVSGDREDKRARELARLFRETRDAEAWAVIYHFGAPLMIDRLHLLDGRAIDPDESEFDREEFLLLEAICGLSHPAGFDAVARAGQDPGLNDSFMWNRVLNAGTHTDPDYLELIKQLSKNPPENSAGVVFLDISNTLSLDHDLEPHPLSSDVGVARLRGYLGDPDPDHASYAVSAAAALAFIGHPKRDELLSIAEQHADLNTRVEAAWAGAKIGRPESIARLAEFATDWKSGSRARSYLEDLELAERLPDSANDPRHRALCEMAEWLQHPNELGKLPVAIEIFDHREIDWPPVGESAAVSLVRWVADDGGGEDQSIGMTGGTTTWCFFSKQNPSESPLDEYARHCNWQLQQQGSELAPEDYDDLEHGRKLLQEANPDEDWQATG